MIQIGGGLPPVDEAPIEHLVACHDRILARLSTLERVGENLDAQPAAALSALINAIRFLDTSGVLHTRDEEESIFPRLRPYLPADDRAYLDSLEAQHREKEEVYAQLKAVALELHSSITPERVEHYRQLATRLAELYRAHIASENTILVRLGKQCLNDAELDAVRREMKARRSGV